MLVYNVTAAPPTAKDVVSRELSVAENGEPVGTTTYPPDATDLGDFSFSDNTQVAMTLVDIDDAGNRSQPAVLEFVATDTIAPSQPGGFGVTLVREE